MSNYIEEKLKEFDREFVKNLGDKIDEIRGFDIKPTK